MSHSPFDLKNQQLSTDGKIVVALERISEAFKVLLWNESKATDLSPIQIQMLIFLRFHPQEMAKVSYLAKEFNLTKATVSDSVKTLIRKSLIEKVYDQADSRSFTMRLTQSGNDIAERSANFADAIESPVSNLSQRDKDKLLSSLLNIIGDLRNENVIALQRMCFTCSHYSTSDKRHYCNLLNTELSNVHLRIDCQDHEELE